MADHWNYPVQRLSGSTSLGDDFQFDLPDMEREEFLRLRKWVEKTITAYNEGGRKFGYDEGYDAGYEQGRIDQIELGKAFGINLPQPTLQELTKEKS